MVPKDAHFPAPREQSGALFPAKSGMVTAAEAIFTQFAIVDGNPPSMKGVSFARRPADKLAKHPASTQRVYKPEGCKVDA